MLGSREIKELCEKILSTVENQEKRLSSFETEINRLKIEKDVSEKENFEKIGEVVKQYEKDLVLMEKLREDLEDEVKDFKIMKSKVVTKGMDEVHRQMKLEMDQVRLDVNVYNDLMSEVKDVSTKLEDATKEFERLSKIGSSIKETDFELEKFSKQLFSADKEKLELMKKIDTLERLVAQMRRRRT